MKIVLRTISGVLALLSLLLVVVRVLVTLDPQAATVKGVLGLIFPLSITLLFGYMAINGRMPFSDKQNTLPSEDARQDLP